MNNADHFYKPQSIANLWFKLVPGDFYELGMTSWDPVHHTPVKVFWTMMYIESGYSDVDGSFCYKFLHEETVKSFSHGELWNMSPVVR